MTSQQMPVTEPFTTEEQPFSADKSQRIKSCPKCGCDEAVIAEFASGRGFVRMNLMTGKGELDYSEIYLTLKSRRVQKYWYCSNCGKRLFRDIESISLEDKEASQ